MDSILAFYRDRFCGRVDKDVGNKIEHRLGYRCSSAFAKSAASLHSTNGYLLETVLFSNLAKATTAIDRDGWDIVGEYFEIDLG